MDAESTFTERLARICRDLAEQPLPGEVTAKAKLCLLDHLAVLLYGARSSVEHVGRGMLEAFGSGGATLVARKQTASLEGAAFYHGLIATAEDLDDSHRFATGIHLSAVTIPATLALGEERRAAGEQFLRAVTAGYEVSGRLCRAVDSGLRARGWHSTGAVGPFGACAASSVLLGLDQTGIAHALGIAASSAGGLFAFLPEGATVRHVHGAWASANGLAAALLAASGMTGAHKVLEGKDGYLSAYTASSDPTFIVAPSPVTSGTYEIMNAYHKLYASCGHAYPSISAALALREEVASRLSSVKRIEARVYKASAALTNPAPRTVDEAKFSLPFLLAIAFAHGDLSRRRMCMETIRDPQVRELAARVTVREDRAISSAFPRLRSAELVLTMADGSEIRKYVDAPRGMPENPVGWRELEEKFRDAAQGVFSAGEATRIVEAVREVDRLASIGELTHLLKL